MSGLTPIDSRALGIRMIFQETSDAPTLTVAENVCLGDLPNRRGVVNWKAVRERARQALAEFEIELDLNARMGELSVGKRQLVEVREPQGIGRSGKPAVVEAAELGAHRLHIYFHFEAVASPAQNQTAQRAYIAVIPAPGDCHMTIARNYVVGWIHVEPSKPLTIC